jgi:hypothetical protein
VGCRPRKLLPATSRGYNGPFPPQQATADLQLETGEKKTESPTRLIDLGFFGSGCLDACLFNTNGRQFQYVSLSYCWGASSMRSYITTKSNFDGKIRLVKHTDMPQTIQDAFRICRELEFRYIWVDAICIIQDSKADWHSEASKMGWIYRNSHLTISADLSDNVELGCFNNHSLPQTINLEALVRIIHCLGDGRTSSLFFYLPTVNPVVEQIFEGSLLSERGWAFQERVLSPRILHYTNLQLIWECREAYETEDGLRMFNHNWEKLRTLCGVIAPRTSSIGRDLLLFKWYQDIVQPYSLRQFSFWTDRLVALAGLAEDLVTRLDAGYVAGLWLFLLEFGLCWRRSGPPHVKNTFTTSGPTFSWSRLLAPVHWPLDAKFRNRCTSLVTLIEYGKGVSLNEGLGDAQGAWLRLRGRLRSARFILDFDDDELFDKIDDGEWLLNALHEREDREEDEEELLIGDVVLDTDQIPQDIYCLLLHIDEESDTYALLLCATNQWLLCMEEGWLGENFDNAIKLVEGRHAFCGSDIVNNVKLDR